MGFHYSGEILHHHQTRNSPTRGLQTRTARRLAGRELYSSVAPRVGIATPQCPPAVLILSEEAQDGPNTTVPNLLVPNNGYDHQLVPDNVAFPSMTPSELGPSEEVSLFFVLGGEVTAFYNLSRSN